MSDTLIKVEGLYKKFCQSLKRSMIYGTVDAAKSMFGFPIEDVDLRKREFWALQDINFELKRGETLGLIGQNGCGKTTLLRLLNGIYPPDKGKIIINGRIGGLIAVGAGFHPHMTGRENIYLNGSILGMSKAELTRKFDSIVAFAEIGNFIDSPVASYSSGMNVRLGFAIAIHCEPDVLLLDEILAVGDYNFQYKCYEKIRDLKRNGTCIVFVSHSEVAIKAVCQKGILLKNGRIIIQDEINTVIEKYIQQTTGEIKQIILNKSDILENNKIRDEEFSKRRGIGKVRFTEIYFADHFGNKVTKVPFGTKTIKIVAKYFAVDNIKNVKTGLSLKDASKSDQNWSLGAVIKNDIISIPKGEGELIFEFDIATLGPNIYGLYIGLIDSEMKELSYDIWDINNTMLEIETNVELIKNNFSITKPYLIVDANYVHNTNG